MSELKRVKYFKVTPEVVLSMLLPDVKVVRMRPGLNDSFGNVLLPERQEEVTFTGVPKDAQVCGASYDFDSDSFMIRVESAEFPEVPPCATCEPLAISCTSKLVEPAKRGREFI